MEEIKVLFIEDEENSTELFWDEINEFNETNTEININPTIKKEIDIEVFEKILDWVDFIITDLRLLDWQDGNEIIKIIKNKNIVPLYVVTWHKWDLEDIDETNFYKIYFKWEENVYEKVLNDILHLYKTWITKVIWKHWKVNEILNKLIWNGGLDNIREWERFNNLEKAEKSLGRYILSHIHHELSWDYEDFHPEEVYLKNMWDNKYVTWTILEKDWNYFIILTPACDIAQDRCDYFLVTEIESNVNLDEFKKSLKKAIDKLHKCLDEDCKNKKLNNIKKSLDNYKSSNSKKDKFLPKSTLFVGWYIRFDRLHKINLSEIKSYKILCYVSEHFLADIIADFWYYYSRQWQPNLANKIIISNLLRK